MSPTQKSLIAIIGLILATTAALAAMESMVIAPQPGITSNPAPDVTLSTEVVQDKVLKDGDGRVTVAMDLTAARRPAPTGAPQQAADLVIVLDRSGSMEGQKISDARRAVIGLIELLSPQDRLALVTYSNGVQTRSNLAFMDDHHRRQLAATVEQIRAGGGTNLGGGLARGIDLLMGVEGTHRQRKLILISDGLANQGITDPQALGQMASAAVENRFSISTVGVGLDFNELLMTAIADRGAGHYHFLEDPRVFARVFETEFQATRQVVATDVRIRIPLEPGVQLVAAGGYPILNEDGAAVFFPGNLLSGQTRKLYLTFEVPTDRERKIRLGQAELHYRSRGDAPTVLASRALHVTCVSDPKAVLASIKKESWGDQVVQEAFGRLKAAVAADVRGGDPQRAEQRIGEYAQRQAAINAVVKSPKVTRNLTTDLDDLRHRVDETFTGAPAAVAEKKKQVSKALQYDGYKQRRDQK